MKPVVVNEYGHNCIGKALLFLCLGPAIHWRNLLKAVGQFLLVPVPFPVYFPHCIQSLLISNSNQVSNYSRLIVLWCYCRLCSVFNPYTISRAAILAISNSIPCIRECNRPISNNVMAVISKIKPLDDNMIIKCKNSCCKRF